jgi:DUF1009 family protein
MTGPANRIGIIAGSGSLPREVAESIVARGGSVHVVMVDGAAEAALAMFPHTVVNWAQPGRTTAALKQAGVRDVVMLGGFQRPSFRSARPDFGFFQMLPRVVRLLRAGGDDAVLRGLVALFERRGLKVVGVGDVAPDLLAEDGVLTARAPSSQDDADAATGLALVAALGRYDIGQAVVVANGRVEAIEGAEGTDRMLKRVAEVRRSAAGETHGGVLVKRPKPGQDLRVDLPAIGPNTMDSAAAAGLSGVAVMAGHVLCAERPRMIAAANARGVFVAGVSPQLRAEESDKEPDAKVAALGAISVDDVAVSDIRRSAAILAVLTEFDTGSAVVIDRRRVIAVGADEAPNEVICRAAGLRGRKRRRGVVVVGPTHFDGSVMRAAADGMFAGVAVIRQAGAPDLSKDLVSLADQLGVFIAAVETGSDAGEHSRG